MEFENLHQVLRNLYEDMIPLCDDMIGVAKGLAGLGALFYVAYRVWQALARAEVCHCKTLSLSRPASCLLQGCQQLLPRRIQCGVVMDFDVGYACGLLKRLGSPHTGFHLVGCFSPPCQ